MKLSNNCVSGGCASKIEPKVLSTLLSAFPKDNNENILVGFETSDDACIYKINDDIALVQTLDFFPPMLDDPYIYGQIAATNALSDVYAMGGKPLVAMNIVCFPREEDKKILSEILRGGLEKAKEASVSLGGGHSIYDEKIKYGLSVTGIVNPNKVWTNSGAEIGDVLFYTKKIGTGIVTTANNNDVASKTSLDEAILQMTTLNRYSYEIMLNYPISSCTDVTGFSFLGHSTEMVRSNSDLSFIFDYDKIPKISNVEKYSKDGFICSGGLKNKEFFSPSVNFINFSEWQKDILFDPQTSGGFLFSISKSIADKIKLDFSKNNLPLYEVGEVTKRQENLIIVK